MPMSVSRKIGYEESILLTLRSVKIMRESNEVIVCSPEHTIITISLATSTSKYRCLQINAKLNAIAQRSLHCHFRSDTSDRDTN